MKFPRDLEFYNESPNYQTVTKVEIFYGGHTGKKKRGNSSGS